MQKFRKSISWLLPKSLGQKIFVSNLSYSRRRCLEFFATADALATEIGSQWGRATRVVYALGVASVSSLPFIVEGMGLPWSLAAYVLCLVSAASMVLWMRREQVESDHVESRAFAEMLRIQFAWLFAGIEDLEYTSNKTEKSNVEMQGSVMAVVLGQQQREMGWISRVLANLILLRSGKDEFSDKLKNEVLRSWISGQLSYSEKTAIRAEERVGLVERLALYLVSLGLALALISVFLLFFGEAFDSYRHFMVPFSAALPVIVIVLEGAVDRVGGGDQARMRKRLGGVYAKSLDLIDRDLSRQLRERVVIEVGREAASEATAWLFLRRIRPVRVSI